MSRWLKSVNTLLEQLDGQVETAVEEHAVAREVEQGRDTVDDILAKRGLVQEEEDDDEPEVQVALAENEPGLGCEIPMEATADVLRDKVVEEPSEPNDQVISLHEDEATVREERYFTPRKDFVTPRRDTDDQPGSHEETTDEGMEEVILESAHENVSVEEVPVEALESKMVESDPNAEKSQKGMRQGDEPSFTSSKPPLRAEKEAPITRKDTGTPPGALESAPLSMTEYKKALADAREAQKESRTLRRHVVSLNSQLEVAEAENHAQRTELERAAERMEKDRTRQKEEKERLAARHAEELKALKLQHEQNVNELKGRSDQQLVDARKRMKELEERRMQEGGDWTKELEGALQREQESARRIAMLE